MVCNNILFSKFQNNREKVLQSRILSFFFFFCGKDWKIEDIAKKKNKLHLVGLKHVTVYSLQIALRNGHIEMSKTLLNILSRQSPKLLTNICFIPDIICRGTGCTILLKILEQNQYVNNTLTRQHANQAAGNGYLHTLQWLALRGIDCTEEGIVAAHYYNNPNVIIWLREIRGLYLMLK